MKSTSVHFLPVELLAFLDIAPYLFLNRDEDPHTFWTATAGVMNLRHVAEVALKFRETDTLTELLTLLKTSTSREVIAGGLEAAAADEDLASIDTTLIGSPDFKPVTRHLQDPHDFNRLMCCLTFNLRYKLVDFEENDNFAKRAEVVFQEPPCVVYNSPESKWSAKYLENIEYMVLEDESGEEHHLTRGVETKETPLPSEGWETPPKTPVEDVEAEGCRELLQGGGDSFFATSQENESGVDMVTPIKRPESAAQKPANRVSDSSIRAQAGSSNGSLDEGRGWPVHFHFHLPEGINRVSIQTSGGRGFNLEMSGSPK